MIELKNNPAGNFFLLAGPCVIEGEEMAMRIAERVVKITEVLQIPYVFKGSYRKANRSRLDSFTGIGDEKALKVLRKVHETFGIPKLQWQPNTWTYFKSQLFFVARPTCWLPQPKPEKQLTSRKDSSFHRRQCSLLPTKWWKPETRM